MSNNKSLGVAHLNRRVMLSGTAAVLAAPYIVSSARAEAPAVNVGVIMPLSGPNAQFGINSRNGIELVANEINMAGGIAELGGAKINLVVADATSTPTTAGTVAQRLITQQDITAVLGAFASSLTLAISEVTERRDIPLLTMSFADQITGRGYKNVFQVVAKASVIGKAQFDYTAAIARAAGAKIDKVAIMYEDTAYGTAQANGLRAGAKAANVEMVMDDAYPLGITDTTPLINKLRGSGAQAVFPVSYLNDSLLIIRTMRQQKLTIPAIGGAAGYVIPDFEKGLGAFAENVLSIDTSNYDLAPELTERFRKRFGYFMVHEALEHAVCLEVLVQAIKKAKSAKAEAVAAAIRGAKFTGGWINGMTGGAVAFDQTGLNVLSVPLMVQWRAKDLVTVWPKDIAKERAGLAVLTGGRREPRVSFLQAILDGLLIGGVYAVISIGLTLVYGVMGIVNFAQAEFLTIGMFVAWFAWAFLGLDPILAAPLSFAVAFAIGWVVQGQLIARVLSAPSVAQIFLTVGILIVIENGSLLLFGSQFRSVTTAYQTISLSLGPLFISVPYLIAFSMSLLCGIALWWFMRSSWFGRAMRATAQNPAAARLMGIDTELMYRIAFALGVGLTAFGGAVILPYVTVFPGVGGQFVVLMFTVVVLGGLGSVAGAVVGGLAVGVIQSLSSLFFPIQLQNLVLFIVFILVLAVRPQGLIGAGR